ncbi:MAG: molybdenum cofactor sulfurtransferase [Maribacter sp.]|jgi:molybdenum cofactor sulfurtransferase
MTTMPIIQKDIEKDLKKFLKKFPEYKTTAILDELRKKEYSRLDEEGHIYLDYTGGNLYAMSQIKKHHELLRQHVFGNPHSSNPTSNAATQLEKATRHTVLDFFNASDDYYCVFTANASAGLKIVGECYPFDKDGHFLLSFDNHNSVNGIREFAKNRGSSYQYAPLDITNLRMSESKLEECLNEHDDKKNKLFAFPAQSNVSGVKHPLKWIKTAQEKGWDVLLDAAAFVPSSPLDLKEYKPDFVTVSFYKIFGYPTGIGALLIKKSSFDKLNKPWFAGGTVTFAAVNESFHSLKNNYERFEDGTINYLGIPAVKIGLEYINEIGIDTINTRVHCLTGWLLDSLQGLQHDNGNEVVNIIGPKDLESRGGTIILNFCDKNGKAFPWDFVEYQANQLKISLRTGCFCNPGIDEIHSCVTAGETAEYFDNFGTGSFKEIVAFMGKLRGAVRISVGIASNFNDVTAFLAFAEGFQNQLACDIEFGSHFGK